MMVVTNKYAMATITDMFMCVYSFAFKLRF